MIDPLIERSFLNNGNSSAAVDLQRRSLTGNARELREVVEEFESLFVKMMLDSMRKTLDESTLIPKNAGEKLFEDELYSEYAQKISRSAKLGIADMMYNQLSAAIPGEQIDLK